jgi:hypothetical protein
MPALAMSRTREKPFSLSEVGIDPGPGADARDAEALALQVLRGPDLRPGDQLRRHARRVHRHQQFQVAAFGHGLQDSRHADDAEVVVAADVAKRRLQDHDLRVDPVLAGIRLDHHHAKCGLTSFVWPRRR